MSVGIIPSNILKNKFHISSKINGSLLTAFHEMPASDETNTSSGLRLVSLAPTTPEAMTIPGADLCDRMGVACVPGYHLLNSCEKCNEQFA